MQNLIETKGLRVYFPIRKSVLGKKLYVHAVDGVDLSIGHGEIVTLIGESGCGKTTLGKTIVGLIRPTAGSILFEGHEVSNLSGKSYSDYRRGVQIIHQDPFASLNPTKTVLQILSTPLRRWGISRSRSDEIGKVVELLRLVGLTPPEEFINKYPHQLSGGQRQRISVARAISVNPKLIVADEPITMIDVSLRIGILDLLLDLQKKFGTAYLFITHDFGAARYFSGKGGGRIAVMYLGKVIEVGPAEEVIQSPLHPYTKVLLSAVPEPDPEVARRKKMIRLKSLDIPSPINPPPGCRFHTRCPYAMDVCGREEPPLVEVEPGHYVACWLYSKG